MSDLLPKALQYSLSLSDCLGRKYSSRHDRKIQNEYNLSVTGNRRSKDSALFRIDAADRLDNYLFLSKQVHRP